MKRRVCSGHLPFSTPRSGAGSLVVWFKCECWTAWPRVLGAVDAPINYWPRLQLAWRRMSWRCSESSTGRKNCKIKHRCPYPWSGAFTLKKELRWAETGFLAWYLSAGWWVVWFLSRHRSWNTLCLHSGRNFLTGLDNWDWCSDSLSTVLDSCSVSGDLSSAAKVQENRPTIYHTPSTSNPTAHGNYSPIRASAGHFQIPSLLLFCITLHKLPESFSALLRPLASFHIEALVLGSVPVFPAEVSLSSGSSYLL